MLNTLESQAQNKPGTQAFLKELKGIMSASFSEISSHFKDEPGIVFAKSYLLTSEIWTSVKQENRRSGCEKWIEFLALSVEEAGLDATMLRNHSKALAAKGWQHINKFETEGVDLLKFVPPQEGIFVLLFALFAVRNL